LQGQEPATQGLRAHVVHLPGLHVPRQESTDRGPDQHVCCVPACGQQGRRTALDGLLRRINTYLVRWARWKYKRLRTYKKARKWWDGLTARQPRLFDGHSHYHLPNGCVVPVEGHSICSTNDSRQLNISPLWLDLAD
jgi:hypothetical protein